MKELLANAAGRAIRYLEGLEERRVFPSKPPPTSPIVNERQWGRLFCSAIIILLSNLSNTPPPNPPRALCAVDLGEAGRGLD